MCNVTYTHGTKCTAICVKYFQVLSGRHLFCTGIRALNFSSRNLLSVLHKHNALSYLRNLHYIKYIIFLNALERSLRRGFFFFLSWWDFFSKYLRANYVLTLHAIIARVEMRALVQSTLRAACTHACDTRTQRQTLREKLSNLIIFSPMQDLRTKVSSRSILIAEFEPYNPALDLRRGKDKENVFNFRFA